MTRFFALVFAAALAAACNKTEPAPSPAPAASSTATPLTAASVAPPSTPKEATSATATGSATPAASGSAAAVDCGTKENPCPLQGWMRENVNPPMNKNDMPALAIALDKIAGFAPPGYTNWASISKDGAAAARNGDMTATKASCRSCHEQYKQKYKNELRARKI